jgi:hypothetical protein
MSATEENPIAEPSAAAPEAEDSNSKRKRDGDDEGVDAAG